MCVCVCTGVGALVLVLAPTRPLCQRHPLSLTLARTSLRILAHAHVDDPGICAQEPGLC